MKITKEWLQQQNACQAGQLWFASQKTMRVDLVVKKLIKKTRFDWANWTITHLMTHKQNVQYACFASLQSIEYFEKVFPTDSRPRLAIKAALEWVNSPTEENKLMAFSAALLAAWSAEPTALSAAESARSAAGSAALSASSAALSAAESALSAAESAKSAAWAAWLAATLSAKSSAESVMWKKILMFGLDILSGKVLDKVFLKWIN